MRTSIIENWPGGFLTDTPLQLFSGVLPDGLKKIKMIIQLKGLHSGQSEFETIDFIPASTGTSTNPTVIDIGDISLSISRRTPTDTNGMLATIRRSVASPSTMEASQRNYLTPKTVYYYNIWGTV